MDKFVIKSEIEKISSINRTIRIKTEVYENLCILAEKNGISFNNVVNQCIDFALTNLSEEKDDEK